MDKKSPSERQADALEALVVEVANIRVLLERSIIIKQERKRELVKKVVVFDAFLDEFKGLNFDGESIEKMFDVFEKWRVKTNFKPITKNKFSRSVHKLGYDTVVRNNSGITKRVFVKREF